MFVVSKGGTFGTLEREYKTETGHRCFLIRWGPLGWLTPARAVDCKKLASYYEHEAKEEADVWLQQTEQEGGKDG